MRVVLMAAILSTGAMSVTQTVVPEQSDTTLFEPGQDDVVVPVTLNGRGPFRFLVDTGSTHTAVSAKTVAHIGAPVVAKAPMASAAGSRDMLVVRIDALEVGPLRVSDLLASVAEPAAVGEEVIDGVLGQDALASIRYAIDFRQRRIVWWPKDALATRGSSLSLQPSHGRFLVSLPQRQSVLQLVPDSGAESLLLFNPDPMLPVTDLRTPATLRTTSGETEVRIARMRELRVGALTLRDVPVVVAERSPSEPAEVDGLLPLHLFDRVTFDGPGRRMIVEKAQESRGLMFF
jgi:predicted aspartyl protease